MNTDKILVLPNCLLYAGNGHLIVTLHIHSIDGDVGSKYIAPHECDARHRLLFPTHALVPAAYVYTLLPPAPHWPSLKWLSSVACTDPSLVSHRVVPGGEPLEYGRGGGCGKEEEEVEVELCMRRNGGSWVVDQGWRYRGGGGRSSGKEVEATAKVEVDA